ncbi:hypothetical protein DsansV1_C14g0130861 [Dioscorea sansibarensis]
MPGVLNDVVGEVLTHNFRRPRKPLEAGQPRVTARGIETLTMRAVRGTVTSARPISVTKAAAIMARFADAGAETGARSDVAAYLRCASAAFEELAQVHKELRGERRRSQDEIHGGEEENEKGKKERKRKEKRNPALEELDGKWKSSDLDGGIAERSVGSEEERDLEDIGLVLKVEKEKKRKENDLDENEAGEEEKSDFGNKSESMINEKKRKRKKDRDLDNIENLGEGEKDGMKKETRRRNSEVDETEFEVGRIGLDGDWKKRKHSEDGVVDERELHNKKKRKTKEQQS